MSAFPWLTTIGLIPAVGSVLLFLLPGEARRSARQIALVLSLVTLALAVVATAVAFDVSRAGTFQLTEQAAWIPSFGVTYALGVNGVGLIMILLSVILVPLCILAAWHEGKNRPHQFFAWILLAEAFMVGVFAARDVFLFYIFFEAMLIPMYFLIGSFGGPNARHAALKFLIYSLAGGLIMLIGVIALGVQTIVPGSGIAPDAFLIDSLVGIQYSSLTVEMWIFVAFFIAFAVKAPMVPVHTWLADAAEQAPPAVSVLIVGVLDKVGTFGMLVLCLPLFPEASKWAAPVIAVLAVISIIYGALAALAQRDLRRLIAFTSVSHFGFIVLGIFVMTSAGQAGSVLYMVNHGFSTAGLFLVCGMLMSRWGTATISEFGGIQRVTPLLAGIFLVAGMSSLALPGLSSFVSEFLVLVGTFHRWPVAGAFATLGIVLAALYILLTYKKIATGPVRASLDGAPDLSGREKWVLVPVVVALVGLGFFPKPVLDVINPVITETMATVGVEDPAPLLSTQGVDQ